MLEDDVWRLEKIGKDGVFHKKLVANDIKTVQDFLRLSIVNEPKLRKVSLHYIFCLNIFYYSRYCNLVTLYVLFLLYIT